MNPLIAFLLLFRISFISAQSPIPQPLTIPPDEIISIPINIPPSKNGTFEKETIQISVTSPTNVLAELYISSSPPHSGSHAPLLSARASIPPSPPSISEPCSQSQPCPPEPFDDVAFYTRADTASIILSTEQSTVHVTVYNWNIPGLPNTELAGTLFIRAVASEPAACPWAARAEVCRDRGRCPTGESNCICNRGWGGPSCGTRLTEAPPTSERPSWDGEVKPMRDSAVVSVPTEGITYVWRISGTSSRVEFRARVLRGDVVVDGKRESVDGGGGRFEMVVKRAHDNLGEGLEEGTRLPTVYDTGGLGQVAAKTGGVFEVVVVSEGVRNWVMALIVDQGEAVVSVSARRCGEDGLLDCALSTDEGGFPVGVAVGVSVVAVVVLVALLVLCLCCMKRKRNKERNSVSGAWTDVDFSKIDAMQEEGKGDS